MPAPLLLATSLPRDEEAAWRDALAPRCRASASSPQPMIPIGARSRSRSSPTRLPARSPAFPALAWVHSLWAGVERLLRDETLPPVPVVRLVDPALARAMAEGVAAGVLALHRDLPVYAAQQRRREWRPHPVRPAHDRPVAILGMGEMGRAAAALLIGLGFPVRGWSRTGSAMAGVAVHAGPSGLATALDGAEFLVNLLPLTAETQGILARDLFARLPQGAGLINFGRGAHLVEADLWDALDSGRIGHAILDVFTQEPLPAEHPAWTHPGVSVLPHVAGPTDMASAGAIVAEAVARFRATGRIPTGIDRTLGY